MANYHLEVQVISRGQGRSVTKLANYITGRKLHDSYYDKTYYRKRDDVLYSRVFQPDNAPPDFYDLQYLCNKIDEAEIRYDAQTAREFKGSLPNELPFHELTRIVGEFTRTNFVNHDLCAIAAIHEGRNANDLSRNNPHVHIIVPIRTVGPDGFSRKKDREHNKSEYLIMWRKDWADVQNRAYERSGLDIRVSHESLEVQGIDRKPTPHLSLADWQREKRGEHTDAGDKKREIEARNRERALKRDKKRERVWERSR